MEGVKWLLQCLNQKGECVWNACNYQMYEIDNGINQTKCQNPGPMCSVQCWMSGSRELWLKSFSSDRIFLTCLHQLICYNVPFLYYLLDQFMICKLIISFYFCCLTLHLTIASSYKENAWELWSRTILEQFQSDQLFSRNIKAVINW